MTDPPSPAIDVRDIHRLPDAEAMRFVDNVLGPPDAWPSPLIKYRLGAEFQADWKVELGQWLKAAREFGFLDQVLHQLRTQAQRPSKADTIDPNDERHLKLHQHLAVARITHYLTALGWGFDAFEPDTGSSVDIDLSLRAPDGKLVEFQVKAPDQPGRRENGRIVDGENDERIVHAVRKAAGQLRRPAVAPSIIGVCANRDWALSWDIGCLVKLLMGSTSQVGSRVFLTRANAGVFFTDEWAHVSAVLVLDFVRGAEVGKYVCVALMNPDAIFPIAEGCFPRGRVMRLKDGTFGWVRGPPGDAHTLPDGTSLVDEIPDAAWAELRSRAEAADADQ